MRTFRGIRFEKHIALSLQPVFAAADVKWVQMHMARLKGHLQNVVMLRDAGAAWTQEATSNQRTDATEHGS
jgi:hypothetical protein